LLNESCTIIGTDYNADTIQWCDESIKNVKFLRNNLLPPLELSKKSVDFVYAISVFTHLSEEACKLWVGEMYRLIRPGGIFLFTTAGDYFNDLGSTRIERQAYSTKGIVVRGNYEEGKKMYLTRHSHSYVQEMLLNKFEVISHQRGGFPFMDQDQWIVKAI
jgi:cyclopropane fatty-acyl-phospholipid synthase-like methyltransferase